MEKDLRKRPFDSPWRGSYMDSRNMRGHEAKEKRTENGKVFDLGRGVFQLVQFPAPVHFRDENGRWQDINNNLVETQNSLGEPVLRNQANAVQIELARCSSASALVSISNTVGQKLSWTIRGQKQDVNARLLESDLPAPQTEEDRRADMSAAESSLVYEDLLPHTDVVCRISGTSFKDNIILKSPEAQHTFIFNMKAEGLKLIRQTDGTVLACENLHNGRKVFTMPPAFLCDAEGRTGEVKTELLTTNGEPRLILKCDPAFLEKAAFPVVLDPLIETMQHSSTMEDNFVTSKSPNTVQSYSAGSLRICKNTTYGECRAFLKFTQLPDIDASGMVTKAVLRMTLSAAQGSRSVPVFVKEVLEDWSSRTIKWNNQPMISDYDMDAAIVPANAGVGSQFGFDISNLVRKWYSGQNYGVAFERRMTATPNTVTFGSSDSRYYKPVVIMDYVSFAGLQSHMAYDSMSCGRTGTAHVNLYNGNLVVEREISHCGGNRMPVSITAYYGENISGEFAFMGSKWSLSCDQSLVKDYINDVLYYIWIRGDGSRVYFKEDPDSGIIKDISGMSLTLTDETYIEIEDKQGTVLRFESQDYNDERSKLLQIRDACGNTALFTYTDSYLTSITDGAGRVTTLTYQNGLLYSILAPGESLPVTFSYDDSDLLMMINDADGGYTFCSWTYAYDELYDRLVPQLETIHGADNRYLEFSYMYQEPFRLTRMRMTVPNEDEIIVGSSHEYTFCDNMTTIVTDATVIDGKRLIYQFNDYGNVVSVRDDLGFASYSKFSDQLLPNHPEQVSKLQRSVINLLPYHSFDQGTGWSTVMYYDGAGTFSYATDQKYIGSKSMKVNKTNDAGNMCVYRNYSNLEVGKTYTLSAYIRSTGSVYCYATVSQGTWHDGEKVTPGSEWKRIFTTFTATQTSANLYFITMGGPGTMWIDAAQLEEGSVPNRYNLLENCDFSQSSSSPTFWTENGANDGDDGLIELMDDYQPAFLSANAMRLYGDPESNKGFYQDLAVSGAKDDVYVAGGWAKGYSRPIGDEKQRFAIRVAFKNSSGTYENGDILNWNEEWTDWQFVSGAVIAPCAYTGIRFNVDYYKNVNHADFDGFTLYKEEFGNSFTYDDDGNVVAVKNLASEKSKAEYDDYNNLLSYIQPGRSDSEKTLLDYGATDAEKKRRLPLYITTPMGVRTHNTYDAFGNLIETETFDLMDGDQVIQTSQSMTSDGNHVLTKTDARGKVVSYTTNLAKDTLTEVTDPNNQSVQYTYDSRRRVTGTSAVVGNKTYKNAYTYENDRLKTVSHNTTTATPDVTYTFAYDELGNPTTVKVGTQVLSENVYRSEGEKVLERVEYGNGGKVHYTRDEFNRITGIHYDADTADRFQYEYGANGQAAFVYDKELGRKVWTEYDTSERPIRTHITKNASATALGTPEYVSEVGYDQYGNVVKFSEKVNNTDTFETTYTYDTENKPLEIQYGSAARKLTYTYDAIGRITGREAEGSAAYQTQYAYLPKGGSSALFTTPLIESITQTGENFTYAYDNVGNISSVTRNGLTTTYEYDALGQLTRVNDPHAQKTTVYNYDMGGNITSYVEYAYTNGDLGTPTKTVPYVYGDSNWKDKLTSFDGKAITYDAIGNPLTYDGWTFTWKAGRMLHSMVKTGTTVQFTYDQNGMRTKKVVNGVATEYTLNGKNIVHLKKGTDEMHFFYDAQGKPGMVRFNGTDYFYVYDLQGDVVALIDAAGTKVVEYVYDAWGTILATSGTLAATLGYLNPFRYRGYVYDEETELYYLQSRFYSIHWKRFVNEDTIIGISGEIHSQNAYSYCKCNPISKVDSKGTLPQLIQNFINNLKNTAISIIRFIGPEVQLFVNRQKALSAMEDSRNRTMQILSSTAPYAGTNAFIESQFGKYFWFNHTVTHGAVMDYKAEGRAPWWTYGEREFYFRGKMITLEAYGNINYGYVGKALGIPDVILYVGGGFAAVTHKGSDKSWRPDYFFDSEEDHENISWGIQIYNGMWKE